jgi:hypothetical protein
MDTNIHTDPDLITTPDELRHHVAAALRERILLGDTLARGALAVIEHLDATRLYAKHWIEDATHQDTRGCENACRCGREQILARVSS